MKIVDLSGYSYSGKSAYYDLFSSLITVKSFGVESEFELIRIQGGIYDLFQSLTDDNWSLIRSSNSIQAFKNLVANLAGKRTLTSRLFNLGLYYDDMFPEFTSKSLVFVDKLILSSFNSFWPYPDLTSSRSKFFSKIKRKLFFRSSSIYLSRFNESDLTLLVQDYLNSLFNSFDNKYELCILNNAFETTCPQLSLRFLPNSYSIVIDRDPRDIYTSAYLSLQKGSIQARAVIGSDVSDFIARFIIQRQKKQSHHSNVLRINFEDLMLNFTETKLLITKFLDLPPSFFDSSSFVPSHNNVKSWTRFRDDKFLQQSIKSIEYHLADFCSL